MKVLFSDEVSLYRYSTIEIAKGCRDDIEIFEATNLNEVLNKLYYQDISVLIINVNIFGNVNKDFFRSIPGIRSVLVIDSQCKKDKYEHILPYVHGVLNLDSEVVISRKYLCEVLNS